MFGADEVKDNEEEVADADEKFWDETRCGDCSDDEERQPRTPHDPGRPTKEEVKRHMLHHWPFGA